MRLHEEERAILYQRTRLYELATSTKLLFTGFVVMICVGLLLAVAAAYQACKDADGHPTISVRDLHITIGGSRRPVLVRAAEDPSAYRIGMPLGAGRREKLKDWCRRGAPRADLDEILGILEGSELDFASAPSDRAKTVGERQEAYRRTAALARAQPPMSQAAAAAGIGLYLFLVSVAFAGLGLMFVQSSLFERTKIFFISSTFAMAAACPIFLWLARAHSVYVYPMLLAGLLVVVGLGVFALVAVYDLWFRRPAT
ncbi:MAG: hypothetical protein R6V58_16915 [Planctomycetota bacterium]